MLEPRGFGYAPQSACLCEEGQGRREKGKGGREWVRKKGKGKEGWRRRRGAFCFCLSFSFCFCDCCVAGKGSPTRGGRRAKEREGSEAELGSYHHRSVQPPSLRRPRAAGGSTSASASASFSTSASSSCFGFCSLLWPLLSV
ncbi:uncharacterized protein DS421_18g611960 [Arachis hypogaea]|nr:uncharacterized protein DS421_18g611960 [Arachis hypogaea]